MDRSLRALSKCGQLVDVETPVPSWLLSDVGIPRSMLHPSIAVVEVERPAEVAALTDTVVKRVASAFHEPAAAGGEDGAGAEGAGSTDDDDDGHAASDDFRRLKAVAPKLEDIFRALISKLFGGDRWLLFSGCEHAHIRYVPCCSDGINNHHWSCCVVCLTHGMRCRSGTMRAGQTEDAMIARCDDCTARIIVPAKSYRR